jgi:hypothetical protein
VRGLLVLAASAGAALACAASAAPAGSACPRGLLPLEANSISPAAQAALEHEDFSGRPLVTGAVLATADPDRGPIGLHGLADRPLTRTGPRRGVSSRE